MAKNSTEERLNKLERLLNFIGGDKVKEAENRLRMAEMERQQFLQAAAYEAAARERLPGLREQEQDWQEEYDAWLRQGLALFEEHAELSAQLRAAYGRPQDAAPRRVQNTIKHEAQRRQGLKRAQRGYNPNSEQRRIEHLRRVLEEQKQAERRLASGRHDADQRIMATEAALHQAESKA